MGLNKKVNTVGRNSGEEGEQSWHPRRDDTKSFDMKLVVSPLSLRFSEVEKKLQAKKININVLGKGSTLF